MKSIKDTASSIRKSLRLLRELGYAKLHKRIGEGGRKLGSYYTFSNVPVADWAADHIRDTTEMVQTFEPVAELIDDQFPDARKMIQTFEPSNIQTELQEDLFHDDKKMFHRDSENPKLGKTMPLKDNKIKKPNNIILTNQEFCPVGRVENSQDSDVQNEFDLVYSFYPRHEKRREAEKAFKRITKGKNSNQVKTFGAMLRNHIEKRIKYSAQWAWAIIHDQTKIPLLSSFLNGARWEDSYPVKSGLDADLEMALTMGDTPDGYFARKQTPVLNTYPEYVPPLLDCE